MGWLPYLSVIIITSYSLGSDRAGPEVWIAQASLDFSCPLIIEY
jgi:hypothetical protein